MNKDQLVDRLAGALGRENVIDAPDQLIVYECDGLTIDRNAPHAVVYPTTTEEVGPWSGYSRKRGFPSWRGGRAPD